MPATRCWWWSTIPKSSRRPTGSLISARRAAKRADASWPPARRRTWRKGIGVAAACGFASYTGQVLRDVLCRVRETHRRDPVRCTHPTKLAAAAASPLVVHQSPRRPAAQPQGRRRRHPPRRAHGLLRPQRIGQNLAGHGHDLRRGPAAVRRKPKRLRPAVRRPNAEAQGGSHRGPLAGRGHRAEAFGPHAAEHRRHGHGDLRLPADSHVAAGPAALPGLRRAHRQPVGRRDHRQAHGPSGRHEVVRDGPAGDPRRRALRNALGRDPGVGLRADSRRRANVFRRPAAADRPPAETRRRGGDRPGDGSCRRPVADCRQRGERPLVGPRRAPRGLSARGRARAAMAGGNAQPTFRVRPLWAELRAALAAQLLVQQRPGLVPGVRGPRHANRHQSGRAAARSEAHAGPGRRGALAKPRQPLFSRRCWRHLRTARAFPSTCPSTSSAAATAG